MWIGERRIRGENRYQVVFDEVVKKKLEKAYCVGKVQRGAKRVFALPRGGEKQRLFLHARNRCF